MKTKTQKPMITILGSDHLDNPGINFINTQYDDVLLPHRQPRDGYSRRKTQSL